MLHSAKHWLKAGNTPLSRLLYQCAWQMLHFELPQMKILSKPLLIIHLAVTRTIQTVLRVCYWTPLFKASLEGNAKQLYLYGGLPYISGPLKIRVGERSRISGQTTFSGRIVQRADNQQPKLTIGTNVDIGWQTTIAVGTEVFIGNNVRIAGRALLAGYPGHPVNAEDRAAGKPDLDGQIGDIVREDDVWLATGVSVMAGVRIGQGTIVAAGSVVTHDLPPGVLAGGIPAKVIKSLEGVK
ncbi:MAG: acyltransferase [Psychrosphaera sp.]|nr:acyltransferase [Psychrosphaera sp.]